MKENQNYRHIPKHLGELVNPRGTIRKESKSPQQVLAEAKAAEQEKLNTGLWHWVTFTNEFGKESKKLIPRE